MREATSCGSSARCAQAASGHRTWPPAPSPGSPAPGRSPAAADGHPRRVPARVGSAPWRRTATVRRRWPPLGWRWGASSMARVRPLSKAAAWWSRSSGVPSPSGAMAMTERVRPLVASSRATRAPREYPATWNWATPSRSSSPSMASARAAAVGMTPEGRVGERPKPGRSNAMTS
jgi:hypothetical protein